nr:hypothetical protein [Burkholderia cepacia]
MGFRFARHTLSLRACYALNTKFLTGPAKTSGSAAQGPVGYPYYIETADGRVHSGVLDASGELPRVHTGDGSGDYTVYWGDEAIAKKHTGVSHA